MKQNAVQFVKGQPVKEKYSVDNWAKFFKEKSVGYDGLEASTANEICLEFLEPGLPLQSIA